MPDPVVPRRAFVAGSVIGAVHMAVGGSAGTVPVSPVVPANVQVTSDRFAAHIEPCLAVNPRCRDNLLAACRVFEGPLIGIAAYASFDGGGTWSCTGLLPGLVADSDGNASVAFDARGRGFVCGVVADGATRRGDVPLWVTGDGGRSFQPPVIAIAGGGGLTDHPSLAIDHGSASSPPRLYMAARLYGTADDGVVFVRSRDGGRSFEQTWTRTPARRPPPRWPLPGPTARSASRTSWPLPLVTSSFGPCRPPTVAGASGPRSLWPGSAAWHRVWGR
ncbi:hypothetical protein [Streptomyces mirabilis]|uniref:hypothetical protein n=1 Tax=Streptomyces mirabilis TaxID=68239 RepID=UPI0033F64F81